MADIWSMGEDGEFILAEPYASILEEARVTATKAWTDALIGYLVERTPYTREQLLGKLLEYNAQSGGRVGIFEAFVTQALIGEL